MADIRPTKQWIGGGIRVDAQGHAWKHAVIPPPQSNGGALRQPLGWLDARWAEAIFVSKIPIYLAVTGIGQGKAV